MESQLERPVWHFDPPPDRALDKLHPDLDGDGPSDKLLCIWAKEFICGVDPAFEFTPRQAYGLDKTMLSRLCKHCRQLGNGNCRVSRQALKDLYGDHPAPPRTKMILKRRTAFMTAECPVCYQSMQNCNLIHTKCDHLYHKSCFMSWMKKSPIDPTCPLCRTELETVWSNMYTHERSLEEYSDSEIDWAALEVERAALELEMEWDEAADEAADNMIFDAKWDVILEEF